MRIKILEYLACGKPVITTRKGIEVRRNVVLAEDAQKFAKKISQLIP